MKTGKKIICAFLVMVMCLTAAPLDGFVNIKWPNINISEWFGSKASAKAVISSGYHGANVTWELYDDGTLIISGSGAMRNDIISTAGQLNTNSRRWNKYEREIKHVIIQEGITTVGDFAFYYCENLQTVELPNTIKHIGADAFHFCFNLSEIKIPSSVEFIDRYALGRCYKIVHLTIPASVRTMNTCAVYGCYNLKSVEFEKGSEITSIPSYCFHESPIERITLPASIKSIGYSAFDRNELKDVFFCGTENEWKAISVSSYNQPLTNANIHYNYDYNKKVFPEGYNFEEDSYPFKNPPKTIDIKYYQKMYGDVRGKILHSMHESNGAHGICFGLANTTAMFLKFPDALKSFTYSKLSYNEEIDENYYETLTPEKLQDLDPNAWVLYESSLFNMSLLDFILYVHIYQYSLDVHLTELANKSSSLEGLYNSVLNFVNGNGSAVGIHIYSDNNWGKKDNEHEILAVGVEEKNDGYHIKINDSNIYYELHDFVIAKDFSSWSYKIDDTTFNDGSDYFYNSDKGGFSYGNFANDAYSIGRIIENELDWNLLLTVDSEIHSNTNMVEITNQANISSQTTETPAEKLYWLKDNVNEAEITAIKDGTKVVLADANTSISISLNANKKAEFYVCDENNSSVVYDTSTGDNNKIIITTTGDDILECVIEGTSSSNKIATTQTETGLEVTGISEGTITLTKDDEVIATQTITDAESDIEINYDKNGDSDSLEVEYDSSASDESSTPTDDCSCKCHKTGFFAKLIWKITIFFQKLFKKNAVCTCGVAHY